MNMDLKDIHMLVGFMTEKFRLFFSLLYDLGIRVCGCRRTYTK